MALRRTNKKEWFLHMMLRRNQFYDKGFTAVYINDDTFVMFWKCIPGEEGEGPWLSSQEK